MNVPKVDSDQCTACSICIEICPANSISLVDGSAYIDPDTCSACKACVQICPVEAIS